ncbi:MAG: GNAT family N-acetyltransferase [Desulfobacterales bacterium]
MEIRQTNRNDWKLIRPILHDVFGNGDTYPHSPDTPESAEHDYWIVSPTASYVAVERGNVVGSYYLKPNQPGLGSHVANAGFIVKRSKRGLGIGRAMGRHSLFEAKRLGFMALQFNLVVSTNTASLKLWRSLGFSVVGTLPLAFNHNVFGYVDAFVMYRLLDDIEIGVLERVK